MFRDNVRWKHRWLVDYLTPQYVADRVVDAIATGKAELWIPWQTRLFPLLRLLPTALLDLAHKVHAHCLTNSHDLIVCRI